jgi:hypothetical protein
MRKIFQVALNDSKFSTYIIPTALKSLENITQPALDNSKQEQKASSPQTKYNKCKGFIFHRS